MVPEDIRGIRVGVLLLSGLLSLALGSVTDVGRSISSAVFEIHIQNLKLDRKELYRSGMGVAVPIVSFIVSFIIAAGKQEKKEAVT